MTAAPGAAEYLHCGALLETGPKISSSRMVCLQEIDKIQKKFRARDHAASRADRQTLR
jgi:hypothetical protein